MNELTEMERDFDAMQEQSDEVRQLKRQVADLKRQREKLMDAARIVVFFTKYTDDVERLDMAVAYCNFTIEERERMAEVEAHKQAWLDQQDEMRNP